MFLIICTAISNRGTNESSMFNIVFTLTKFVVLTFLVIVSFFYFDISNYRPLFNEQHGPAGVVVGATLVFYSYLGFDIIPAIAEEAKNPKRDVPRAIIH